MDKKLEPIVKAAQEKFGAAVDEFRGEAHLIIQPENLIAALTYLRDEQKFELLSALTASDYYPQTAPRFHVIYQLTSLAKNLSLQLRAPVNAVNGENPVLPTVTGLYGTGDWRERELFDMFGINFTGHYDLRRLLTPEDSEAHPLRKDFPLGYEEPQFTFNFEEIGSLKPFAKE